MTLKNEFSAENELFFFARRQIFTELGDNLLGNVNWKNKIKFNEVSIPCVCRGLFLCYSQLYGQN